MKKPHLETSRPVLRSNELRAFRLNESNAPKYDGTPASIHRIVAWLDVVKSARYQATPEQTFCNIYAYDFATLCGAYLPRVWWNKVALEAIKQQQDPAVIYPSGGKPGTVIELNANSLYDWFQQYSKLFGWEQIDDLKKAQSLANSGKCVIMVGANKNRSASGHITAIVPEFGDYKATALVPLQSQAGRTNWLYKAYDWQKGHEPLKMYVYNG